MAEQDDLGTAYQGQDSDINDKLLLDLAWEKQQKKVSKLSPYINNWCLRDGQRCLYKGWFSGLQ